MKRYNKVNVSSNRWEPDEQMIVEDDGEWVRYEDARIATADALDKHQHLMDHYMLLKARVAKMEEAVARAIPNCVSNTNVAELEEFAPNWRACGQYE